MSKPLYILSPISVDSVVVDGHCVRVRKMICLVRYAILFMRRLRSMLLSSVLDASRVLYACLGNVRMSFSSYSLHSSSSKISRWRMNVLRCSAKIDKISKRQVITQNFNDFF